MRATDKRRLGSGIVPIGSLDIRRTFNSWVSSTATFDESLLREDACVLVFVAFAAIRSNRCFGRSTARRREVDGFAEWPLTRRATQKRVKGYALWVAIRCRRDSAFVARHRPGDDVRTWQRPSWSLYRALRDSPVPARRVRLRRATCPATYCGAFVLSHGRIQTTTYGDRPHPCQETERR